MIKYFFEGKRYTEQELLQIALKSSRLERIKIAGRMSSFGDILDIGCGIGYTCASLFPNYITYTGVDKLSENVKIAKKLWQTDVTKFYAQIPNKRYDVVLALEVIEHVDDLRGFLLDCRSHLKLGGHLIISTPYALSLTNFLHAIKHRGEVVKAYGAGTGTEEEHVAIWDSITLQNLLVKNGFDIEQVRFSTPFSLHGQSIIMKVRKR